MDTKTREKTFKDRIATIFNLGAVKLNTDTKKIQVMGDDFTWNKNLYGDGKATAEERNAKINSLYDIAEILSDSEYVGKEIEESYKDPTVKPKNKAHKDVKYWYKFKNTISMDGEIYDVTFSIRDKGKSQYQYLIDFHKKGDNSNQPYGKKDLRRAIDESSPKDSISKDNPTVNSKDMRDGEIYSQGKKVAFEKGERVGGNIVYNEASRAFAKKNRAGYKVIQTMAKDLGMKVKFVKGLVDGDGNVLDGVITSEGIFINTESENPTRWAATHEFSHRMKQTGGKAWQRYQDYVIGHLKETGEYQAKYDAKKGVYAENEIDEEIAADYIGELFSDVKALSDFIRESRQTAFSVRNMWYKVLDALGLSDEKKKAQRMWASAYREAMKNANKVQNAEYGMQNESKESKSGTRVSDDSSKRSAINSTNNLENEMNEEYNSNINYSLYNNEVIFSSRYNVITQSETMRKLYDSAKKGNTLSAYNLLSKLLGEDINKVKELGNDVHLLPVVGAEGTSTNVLPKIIAKHIGEETGQNIFDGIYKENSSNSREQSIWGRMKENYPSFKLDEKQNIKPSDITGKKFVLINDNSTTGRTFVGLRNFIEENGGEVVCYYALTTGQDQSEKMITTDETWNELLELGLGKVKNFAEKEGIKREISKYGLTEREAQELIKQFRRKNGDSRGGVKNVERSGRSGRAIHSILETEKKDGSTKKSVSGARVVDNPSVSEVGNKREGVETLPYDTRKALDSEFKVPKEKYTDRYSREKLKARIDSDFTYLHSMVKEATDKRHIPEHLRAEVAAVLDCINFETKQLDRIRDEGKEMQSPTAIKLDNISRLYEDIIRKAWGIEGGKSSKLTDEYLSEELRELKESIPTDESGEFKRLQDMSTEELRVISDVLRGIHHAVTSGNKAFTESIKTSISEISDKAVSEASDVRKKRKGSGHKLEYRKEKGITNAIGAIDKFMNVDMLW